MNDIDQQAWHADVLRRINDRRAARLDEHLPWNWARATRIDCEPDPFHIEETGTDFFVVLQSQIVEIVRSSREAKTPERSCTYSAVITKRDLLTMRAWLIALTGFGDTAVLIPLATVMLVWLLAMRSPRGAVWWAIAAAFCLGMTALLKISFYGCPPMPDLHSPSGHTSLSTLVYGAMTLVTASETWGVRRIMAISVGTGFILAIGASRLLLHAHSTVEVGVGLVIGTAALALFALGYSRYREKEMWLFPLFVAGGVLVSVLHGRELHAEEFLRGMAGFLRIHCS